MIHSLSKIFVAGACALAFSAPAWGGNFEVIHRFKGGHDGKLPGPLLADGNGGFYGTSGFGGSRTCNSGAGCGTVFHILPNGSYTIVYAFKGGSDGMQPTGGVTFGPDGALYGVTASGGGSLNCSNGCGSVFRLTADGQESVIHAFTQTDGKGPAGRLTFDRKGNLYGTTYDAGDELGEESGTVFKISPQGHFQVLHTFQYGSGDVEHPSANVVLDKAGNLYGTASEGGAYGFGGVFKIDANGSESVFYSVEGGAGGAGPYSDLLIDKAGNLYGTSRGAGDWDLGSVFKLTPAGALTVLYSFAGWYGDDDLVFPVGGLIMDNKGNLYGTTSAYSDFSNGGVYRIAPDGTETILHRFSGGKNGTDPRSTLAAGKLGDLYGAAVYGGLTRDACGTLGCGTIFRVTP